MTLLKMLTRTRKRVMSKAMRPGMTSGGTTKLIHDTTTNKPLEKVFLFALLFLLLFSLFTCFALLSQVHTSRRLQQLLQRAMLLGIIGIF